MYPRYGVRYRMFFESPSFSLKITLAAGYWLCEWCSSNTAQIITTLGSWFVFYFRLGQTLRGTLRKRARCRKIENCIPSVDNYFWSNAWLAEFFQLCRARGFFSPSHRRSLRYDNTQKMRQELCSLHLQFSYRVSVVPRFERWFYSGFCVSLKFRPETMRWGY